MYLAGPFRVVNVYGGKKTSFAVVTRNGIMENIFCQSSKRDNADYLCEMLNNKWNTKRPHIFSTEEYIMDLDHLGVYWVHFVDSEFTCNLCGVGNTTGWERLSDNKCYCEVCVEVK